MKIKATLTLLLATGGTSFSQGYIDFSWAGSETGSGVKTISISNPPGVGYYLQGDYSVEAYMAAGGFQSGTSLLPIPATKNNFLGGAITTANGTPATDGSGLWSAGPVDTGLPIGPATIHVRAWYDPNHNLTYNQAVADGFNAGISLAYNILLLDKSDPTLQSLDTIGLAPFVVFAIPEPSIMGLAGLGAVIVLLFRRRK